MIDNFIMPVVKELGVGIFITATAVMAAAAVLTYKFKGSSAETRYTIWGVVFFLLIILPIVSYMVPTWMELRIDGPAMRVPVRSNDEIVENSFAETERDAYGNSKAKGPAARESRNSGHAPITHPEETGITNPSAGRTGIYNAASADANQPESKNVTAAWIKVCIVNLFSIWLLMAVFLISRFVMQVLHVGGITRRAICVEEGWLACDVRNLIASLGIKRRVRVMLSKEVPMPFAWGVFNPAIILPADAEEWPEDRIRSVMTHELAHIARWDYVIHIVIAVVRALYWPNPIVWFATRKIIMERERACDDFALRFGTPSADYAEHLLHIARMQIEWNTRVAAMTMAGEPGLKERIDHVMNGKMNRSPLRKGIPMMAAVSLGLFALSVNSLAIKKNSWHIPDTRGLIKQLNEGKSLTERSMAAWWLGEHEAGEAVDDLLNALGDDASIVRVTSAWALGEIKDRDSIDGLIETLETDKDLLVREMAVLALGEIEDPGAVKALEDAYESDRSLALAVIWALGEIARRGSDDADDVREEIIDDIEERPWNNEQVWTGTLKRKWPRKKNVESLLEDLTKQDEDVRCEAAFALGKVGIEQDFETLDEVEMAVRALINALEDPVPEVRAMAVWSLDEINPSRKKANLGSFKIKRDKR
ncbi:MAG: HEAT repeat domain-containing protein [Candidatus Latescibacterota bacterium]|nr:MAG: HEAT repeat domain-containing protein [Candidatus Latescibacterota bacterium]